MEEPWRGDQVGKGISEKECGLNNMAEKHLGSVLGEAGSRRRAVQAKACSCRVTVQSSGWCRQWTERTEGW